MPKYIYLTAFSNEFSEGEEALSSALETLSDTFAPLVFFGDEPPVIIETVVEKELSFGSAPALLEKTVQDDGETFLILLSKNPSYAGMFLGSLEFLKKQQGLEGKFFAYSLDLSEFDVRQFANSFDRLFSFLATPYTAALIAENPRYLDILLKTFIQVAESGNIEYKEAFDGGEDLYAEILRLRFDLNFKEYTVFNEDPEQKTEFLAFAKKKIHTLKLAIGGAFLHKKFDVEFLNFLSSELYMLENSIAICGEAWDESDWDNENEGEEDEEEEFVVRSRRMDVWEDEEDDFCENSRRSYPAPYGACEQESESSPSPMPRYDPDEEEEEVCVKSRMCDDEEEAPAANISEVQFSAISPKKMAKGDYVMIDVLMYEEAFRWVVDKALDEARRDGAVSETRSGIFEVMANTVVKIVLTSRDAEIIEGEDEKEWFGKHQKFSFVASIPEDYAKKKLLFTAYVYFNGALATKLNILADCIEDGLGEIEVQRNDIKTAFISYASQDRNTVTMIVQGLKMARPDLNVFFDVESLRSGERWEDQLKNRIDSCDVLYLCWSRNAKASKWVDFEWRYAYERKGVGCIEPIPLEEPSLCEPPFELAEKHFNDLMLYIRK